MFSGAEAARLGLVDQIGDCNVVMREKFPDCKIINFSHESSSAKFARLTQSASYLAGVGK